MDEKPSKLPSLETANFRIYFTFFRYPTFLGTKYRILLFIGNKELENRIENCCL